MAETPGLATRFCGSERADGKQRRSAEGQGHLTNLVDMRQDTTAGNRRPDEQVELLVSSDSELQVSRGDTLNSEVFGGVA
jgi:hypothetical protein